MTQNSKMNLYLVVIVTYKMTSLYVDTALQGNNCLYEACFKPHIRQTNKTELLLNEIFLCWPNTGWL